MEGASAAQRKMAMENQPGLRRSCITELARKKQNLREAHAAPSHEIMKAAVLIWVQGVRCCQRDSLTCSSAFGAPNAKVEGPRCEALWSHSNLRLAARVRSGGDFCIHLASQCDERVCASDHGNERKYGNFADVQLTRRRVPF